MQCEVVIRFDCDDCFPYGGGAAFTCGLPTGHKSSHMVVLQHENKPTYIIWSKEDTP